jgi:hypothetical protein
VEAFRMLKMLSNAMMEARDAAKEIAYKFISQPNFEQKSHHCFSDFIFDQCSNEEKLCYLIDSMFRLTDSNPEMAIYELTRIAYYCLERKDNISVFENYVAQILKVPELRPYHLKATIILNNYLRIRDNSINVENDDIENIMIDLLRGTGQSL